MKRGIILGALLALSLPAIALADYSSYPQTIKIKGGLEAAEKEVAAGPTPMEPSSLAHDPQYHNATSYTWFDKEHNTVTCVMPRDGDSDIARCWAVYNFHSARYSRYTRNNH